jgi:NitT/TauT family transport system ATP-binding protein
MELIVDRVSHAYSALPVLDGIALRVGAGEIVVVVGPSGCGKSTLLSIVGGLLRPVAGSVAIAGAVPADTLNPFTFVFQDFALLPWRSVEGNVALPLEHHALGAAERRARVAEALRRTGLTEFRTAFPKQLSGGMRQRVGIARALVVRPAVLLMDEPLSALDAQTRELLLDDFLVRWLDRRVAVLYVTHNLDEALRLADRIVVLSRRPGRVKSIVPIEIPQRERGGAAAQSALVRLRALIWDSIRDEAVIADREIIDA